MRALADDLGIGVMTLYGYAASKEEILEGATLAALEESRPAPPANVGWEDSLRIDARHLHDVCRRHPNLTALVLAQRTTSPHMSGVREHMLKTLLDAGFDRRVALHALGALIYYALGFAAAQAASASQTPAARKRARRSKKVSKLATAADDYTDHISDEAFEYGLELLLSGLSRDRTP